MFGDDEVAIFEDRMLENHVVTIQMIWNIRFPLIMEDMKVNVLKAAMEDYAWDWHKRFGHLNFQNL